MPMPHEERFYEVMWQIQGRGRRLPLPWWVQQYFRNWTDDYDQGLFDSLQAAFASNAHFRYWHMVGVKDHHQESLVGQAGEIEPVYDKYALSFFLFDPATAQLHYPHYAGSAPNPPSLSQQLDIGYLPVIWTTYTSTLGVTVDERVLATTVGVDQRSMVLVRLRVRLTGAAPAQGRLCLAVSPTGPTGFQRRDKGGRYIEDRRITRLEYLPADTRLLVNTTWGPVFDTAPDDYGCYGNPTNTSNPDFYLDNNPYEDLIALGTLRRTQVAEDYNAGMCMGVFAWNFDLSPANNTFTLDVRLPVDDYRGPNDLQALRADRGGTLEARNRRFWRRKLDRHGLQASLPTAMSNWWNLYRICRANLLILSDHGQIHPGPTIYDSFWIRDSSVESIACALAGDENLTEQQLGTHYPRAFDDNWDRPPLGEVAARGFFGQEHERNDREWDANGQALWAIGRFDRIRKRGSGFGRSLYTPYVLEGARWFQRNNRDPYGLLHSGWSAEHLGDKDKPHYWDDFWGLAGLWEAAKLADRGGLPGASEIWALYDDLRRATQASIRWVLAKQREGGEWQTYIPTGPANVGGLDSTMIGILAYFHPCRLYMGQKLGADIDLAARYTLETIWARCVINGGFRHDRAWKAYGPYLTLQMAHTFLLLGDVDRMDTCLNWAYGTAYTTVRRASAIPSDRWQAALGAWNEQHCYPIASDFTDVPYTAWYMGDIPHGWACAEWLLLLRDMLFFEADEDDEPHIYIAPGIKGQWVGDSERIEVRNAPTVFGTLFGYRLTHDLQSQNVTITITQPPPPNVRFVFPCHFGAKVVSATADGNQAVVTGRDVSLPAGTQSARVTYQ
ncbi:MAG: hypothetical protein M3R24_35740 [Chloroflexota bacterium]|nr:hypothetical protein [Chloroflexota bacterium]